MRITLSTDARRDRREAEAYYRSMSPAARAAFRRELDRALSYVLEYPDGAPLRDGEVRAKPLAHFPYTLLYRVLPRHIFVLAIASQMRDHTFYSDRLE